MIPPRARPRARDAAALNSAGGADARCSSLLPEIRIEESQELVPDPDSSARPRAKEANGRFARGQSGNPRGRPKGIRNPRRRPIALLLRQARPGTLAPLAARRPYLLLPLAKLMLPPPLHAVDPGDRLGIDFSRMTDAGEIAEAIGRVMQAVCRGEIGLGEGERLVRRARKPLRAIQRALWRDMRQLKADLRAREREPQSAATPGPRASRPQSLSLRDQHRDDRAVATKGLSLREAPRRSNLDQRRPCHDETASRNSQ